MINIISSILFNRLSKTGEAMIIDPIRDLSSYIRVADEEGLTITHAAETHIHADFASGIRDVAIKLNAYYYGESDDTLGYKICLTTLILFNIMIFM